MIKADNKIGLIDPRNDDTIKWVIRVFLGREPSQKEIDFHRVYDTFESLRVSFCKTDEFKKFYMAANPIEKTKYAVPLFLLPDNVNNRDNPTERAPQKFTLPMMDNLSSQLCSYNQFREKTYLHWCSEMVITPTLHRKQWEFVYILAAMKAADVLKSGCRALGFGTGKEPIPSVLAKYGVTVVASDAPADMDIVQKWSLTNEHGQNVDDLFKPEIVSREDFYANVSWRPIDMNAIPLDLIDFDVCWSACALEHLGSIDHGLQFVRNSLATLRLGGYAIHTTEFNLTSNTDTTETSMLSIFRKCDIERLADGLIREGHDVWSLNFHPGNNQIDEIVDVPPWSLPHLKLKLGNYSCTSIGLVVRKNSYNQ